MRKLYITDLDGTLLNQRGELTEISAGILKALVEDGALVTIATGRSFASLKDKMGDAIPALPVIVHNGARIVDPETGAYLYNNSMDAETVDGILALAFGEHFTPFMNAYEEEEDFFFYHLPANPPTTDYIKYRTQIMPEAMRQYRIRTDVQDARVININIIDQYERLEIFQAQVRETYGSLVDVHITTDGNAPGLGWLTVGDSLSHKAEAIRALAKLISEEPLDITVFGDQLNDIHMFEVANRAIAVSNAHEELLSRANHIIGSHSEDSVMKFIAKEWVEIGENDKGTPSRTV